MKQISQEQIEKVLNTFFQTNISAKDFATVQKFFTDLPDVVVAVEPKVETKTDVPL